MNGGLERSLGPTFAPTAIATHSERSKRLSEVLYTTR